MFCVLNAETAKLPPRRRTRKPEAPNAAAAAADKEENNADDVVDISYVGGNIPSRTFRILREAMGEPDQNGLWSILLYHCVDHEVAKPRRSVFISEHWSRTHQKTTKRENTWKHVKNTREHLKKLVKTRGKRTRTCEKSRENNGSFRQGYVSCRFISPKTHMWNKIYIAYI